MLVYVVAVLEIISVSFRRLSNAMIWIISAQRLNINLHKHIQSIKYCGILSRQIYTPPMPLNWNSWTYRRLSLRCINYCIYKWNNECVYKKVGVKEIRRAWNLNDVCDWSQIAFVITIAIAIFCQSNIRHSEFFDRDYQRVQKTIWDASHKLIFWVAIANKTLSSNAIYSAIFFLFSWTRDTPKILLHICIVFLLACGRRRNTVHLRFNFHVLGFTFPQFHKLSTPPLWCFSIFTPFSLI